MTNDGVAAPTTVAAPSIRHHLPLLGVLLLAIVLMALGLAAPGIGQDDDANRVLARALAWPMRGYMASRSWGFPLFELYAYPLLVHAGDRVARLPAAVFCLATVVLVYRHCVALRGPVVAALIAASVLVLPIVHLPATELMETSLALLLGLAFVLTVLARRAVTEPLSLKGLAALAALAALATAARPDNVIPVMAFGMAGMVRTRRLPPRLLLAALIFAVLVMALYLSVYGRHEMARIIDFGLRVVLPDPWTRKVPRAALGAIAAVGLPFTVLLGVIVWRGTLRASALPADGERLFLQLGAALYAVRFTVLPDEVAYLTVPASVLIVVVGLALPTGGAGRRWLWAAVAALALPNLVQLSLFERPQARLVFRPGLQPGAIYQDLGYRRTNDAEWRFREEARRNPHGLGCSLVTRVPAPDPLPGACLVMNRADMRFVLPDRPGAQSRLNALLQYDRIFVYDGVASLGWHQFMAYEEPPPLSWDKLYATSAGELLKAIGMGVVDKGR